MDIKIKSMSYEECRENFFVNLIRHAENKIKYWKRATGYRCEIDDNLSQAGAEMQYCQDALKALEKQIPKKVTHEATLLRCCTCPTCKNVVDKFEKWGESTVRITYNHCQICGQALDWSDGERKENE